MGSIVGLHECGITIVEGSETDFLLVTAASPVPVSLRARDDQDRRNWVLEIIKQRPIRSIIEMLDDPSIGRYRVPCRVFVLRPHSYLSSRCSYAAWALANQCGGADELKLEIVRQGGLAPLLRFTTSPDEALVGLIYYSLSKLSLKAENKAIIGQHLRQLVDLLRDEATALELKAHALKTLVNLVSEPALRDAMIEQGAAKILIRALGVVHASVQPEAATTLEALVRSGEARVVDEVLGEKRALCAWLESWHGLSDKDERQRKYTAALATVVHVLTLCCAPAARLSEGSKFLRSVCGALPMEKPDCELRVVAFAALFRAVPVLPVELFTFAEPLASACFASKDPRVPPAGIELFARLLTDRAMAERESLWLRVNPVSVVHVLSHTEPAVRAAAASVFSMVALKPGAAARLQTDPSAFATLGDVLLADAELSEKLTASLESLSTLDEIKYALVTGSLREGLLSWLRPSLERADVTQHALAVFANCTSNAGARRALASADVLRKLIDTLQNPSPDVQTRVGSVLANLSTNARIRHELRALCALDPLFACITATKNRHLRLELMGAVCNLCYPGDGDAVRLSDEQVVYLVTVLGSKSIKLRVASVQVLRNACLHRDNCVAINRARGVDALMAFHDSPARSEVQAVVLLIVAACVEVDAGAASADHARTWARLFGRDAPSRAIARCALRCVAAAMADSGHRATLVEAGALPRLLVKCRSSDYACALYAAAAVRRCVSPVAADSLVGSQLAAQLCALLSTRHPVVLQHVLGALADNAKLTALLSTAELECVAIFLDHPVTALRHAAARVLCTRADSVTVDACTAITLLASLPALAPSLHRWTFTRAASSVRVSLLGPFALELETADDVSVLLAKLQYASVAPARRLSLALAPCIPPPTQEDAVVPPRLLDCVPALVEYLNVLSPLAAARAAQTQSVIEDASVAALHAVVSAQSSAAREWGRHAPLVTVRSPNLVSYAAQHRGGPGAALAAGAAPHLGEFAYFEVLVVSLGEHGAVAVGMADTSRFDVARMPGWYAGSFALHSDDGKCYAHGLERPFGPVFGVGDVVGCGIDEVKGELFFTFNGRFLGFAAASINSYVMRPCVALSGVGGCVYTNFGRHSFLWDFSFDARGDAEPLLRPVVRGPEPLALAGGLWAVELRRLYGRLCFLDPAVDEALQQSSALLGGDTTSASSVDILSDL